MFDFSLDFQVKCHSKYTRARERAYLSVVVLQITRHPPNLTLNFDLNVNGLDVALNALIVGVYTIVT